MPDVTMCDSEKCPLAKQCYYNPRSGTKPSEWRQSWFYLGQERGPTETEDCPYFGERNARMVATHDGSEPMTNDEITRLQEAAEYTRDVGGDEMGVEPAAILSLLERLREAEVIVAQNVCGCGADGPEPCHPHQRKFSGCGYSARTYMEKYK